MAAIVPYILFYSSLAFVLYVYFGYPILLLLWRRMTGIRVEKARHEPSVSIIVAAYNETDTIERKILNLLALDYPASKVEVILALDGPTDDTEMVARKYETGRMRVLPIRQHGGKARALNQAVAEATGEILVFADARQLLDRGAVRELASNFADVSVGAVTGELMLVTAFGKESGDAAGLYWRYEKLLRSMESDIHSTMGATGALYAIRRELYQPIPNHTILDDVAIPMRAVLAGKRLVFDRAARVYDYGVIPPASEFRRKVRTLTGNFQLLRQVPELLSPWRNPVFIQFVSHKVGRLFVPYFLAALFASNLFLEGSAYRAVLILQCAWYLLACLGALLARQRDFGQGGRLRGLLLIPFTFLMMNWAAVMGLHHFLLQRHDVWSGYEVVRALPGSPPKTETELPEAVWEANRRA